MLRNTESYDGKARRHSLNQSSFPKASTVQYLRETQDERSHTASSSRPVAYRRAFICTSMEVDGCCRVSISTYISRLCEVSALT